MATTPSVPITESPSAMADIFASAMTPAESTPPPPATPVVQPVSVTPAEGTVPANPPESQPKPTPEVPAETPPAPAPTPTEVDPAEFEFPDDPTKPPPAPDAPKAEPKPDEPSEEDKVLVKDFSKEEETLLLRTNRGKRMLSSFKRDRELEKSPEEGGLGRVPTIDEIRAGEEARMQLLAMETDFASNPQNWLENFFLPDPQSGQFRPGAAELLSSLPRVLASRPEARPLFAQIALPVHELYINQLYQEALEMPESVAGADGKPIPNEVRIRMLDAARIHEHRVFQRVRPLPSEAQPQPGRGTDPEKEALRRQVEAARQWREQQIQTQISQFEGGLYSTMRQNLMGDVESLLSNYISSAYPKGSLAFNAIRDRVADEAMQIVEGGAGRSPINPTQLQIFNTQLERARRAFAQGQRGVGNDVVGTFRKMAQSAIRKIAPDYIREASQAALQQSNSRHASLAPSQSRTEPGGAAPSVSTSTPAQPSRDRQPGEDMGDYARRLISSALQT